MIDYLSVEYSKEKRPLTDYPSKLAEYIVKKFHLLPGQSLLEIGCGRSELLSHFGESGLEIYGVDNAISAAHFARQAKAKFQLVEFTPGMTDLIFNGKKFDIIFSKSFIEHITDSVAYFEWCKRLLVNGGKVISLTPDWETNYRIFFDDFTHVKPFTEVSLQQVLETADFTNIIVYRFRQLPITWNNKFLEFLSKITGKFASHRSTNKWLRWSRELMIVSVGVKPE